jgi:hypothetical protein
MLFGLTLEFCTPVCGQAVCSIKRKRSGVASFSRKWCAPDKLGGISRGTCVHAGGMNVEESRETGRGNHLGTRWASARDMWLKMW